MRIKLTGRRLALAAVLVVGGVAAPFAYASISGKKTVVADAVPLAPVGAASVGSTQTPAAVADNPYQFVHTFSGNVPFRCVALGLPAGQDFVLESVAFVVPNGNVINVRVGPNIKMDPTTFSSSAAFPIPLDTTGEGGTRAFNLVVRPDALGAAAVGDVIDLVHCAENGSPGDSMTYHLIVTGQRIASPTAARVASFDATSAKAGTTLRWTTGSESEILGFNIWRYRGAKGVRVNRTLIRAKRGGEPAGASYRFVDRASGAKRGLTYRLQLVDLKGKRTWYAAFAVASK